MPEIDEEADSLLSNLVLVQNKFDPSTMSDVDIPREEVAKAMKVLLGPPMINDDEAIDVKPVPPYTTPTDVVADTRPLFACRGPFRLPERVSAPVVEKLEVAVDPKYAGPVAEKAVVEALLNLQKLVIISS